MIEGQGESWVEKVKKRASSGRGLSREDKGEGWVRWVKERARKGRPRRRLVRSAKGLVRQGED